MSPHSDENRVDRVLSETWDKAFHAFGTGYIFEHRARRLRRRLRLQSFGGIVFPLLAGGILLAFGLDHWTLPVVVSIAALAGVINLLLSAWSIVDNWAQRLTYASESAWSNYQLADRFKELASNRPSDEEFLRRYELLSVENRAREQRDHEHDLTDREKRRGHRAALREFQRECVRCKRVPSSLTASDCPVCGRF